MGRWLSLHEIITMRTLHLTQTQFEVLYGIIQDTVFDIDEDIVNDTVTYQIYQQLQSMGYSK